VDVSISDEEREVLEGWARHPKSAQVLALRCRIVLAAAEREQSKAVAERLSCTTQTVGRWRGRFARCGIDGLHDEPRPGRPRKIADEEVERVIVKTLEEQPSNATHWSTRSMADATGLNQTAFSWRAFGLRPHRSEHFKLFRTRSSSTRSATSSVSISPPEAAVVLCVGEKSGIQTLKRSSPILPLTPGAPKRRLTTTSATASRTSTPPSTRSRGT
jgi:transposase